MMKYGSLVFLTVTLIQAQAQEGPSSLAEYINIVRYQNTECIGTNNLEGVCLFSKDCNSKRGANIGGCANGYGVCCLEKFTCGGSTSKNETIFVNPNYPFHGENGTNTCQVTVEKNKDICQLRLDLIDFHLAQPDKNGQCTTDSFMVRSTVGERTMILCGDNSGQHMYIDMGRESGNPVVLSVVSNGNKMTRRWKIKISKIKCQSLDMAPTGCLQYYRSPSELVRSFNWGSPTKGNVRYLSNLRYSVCIRVEENFCSIKWETYPPDSFSWGSPFNGGAEGQQCNDDDFIEISQGSTTGLVVGEDRFCGTRLLSKNTIISPVKPFILRIKSNGNATLNSRNSQTGFSLRYTQLPCMF
ncbi:uncharacterized protein LOC143235834 [Tachypleus tridentatus]|uniref:uncharacterized protein LOC143235834 n=1 Tax=Tachypleus tridentatus TaxID=6853 RepID=UPI003FD3D7AA